MKLSSQKKTPILVIFVFLLLFSLIIPNKILALTENFDGTELNTAIWQYYTNGGRVKVSDGFVSLSSDVGRFPYVYLKHNLFPKTGNFSLKVKMQYTLLTLRGDGFVIGNLLPPNNTNDQYLREHDKDIVLFQIWQDSYKHFRIYYRSCKNNNECDSEKTPIFRSEDNIKLNEFQIDYSENRYRFFINENLVFTSKETTRRPTILWIGNPVNHHNSYTWSKLSVDSIEIFPPVTPPPIPSPTPTPKPLDPVILLPGMGASWNHGAMVLGKSVEQKNWRMAPFVKIYDGLLQTLKNAGYKDSGNDKNLFVFNYDWRQPIETTANQLKDYIASVVNPPPGTKIDLIGHSLGGMAARTYVQKNSNNHQIDQLITLGSPHKGAVKTYYLWEGADLNNALSGWERIGAGILLQLHKKDYKNPVEVIHAVIPSLKDLLPTFPYLKRNGSAVPIGNMREKNEWLAALNGKIPAQLLEVLNTFVGISFDTLRWMNVTSRNSFDKLLGKWIDGKPIGREEFAPGDKTVLAESAQLDGANIIELENIDHGGLVESVAGQQAIVNLLGLAPTEIVPAPKIAYESSLVFQLVSPATIRVTDPLGRSVGFGIPESKIPNVTYSPQDKLIIIPEVIKGKYQVLVEKEDEDKKFHLLIGQLSPHKDTWVEHQEESGDEEISESVLDFDPNPSKTKKRLLLLTKEELVELKEKSEEIFSRPDNRVFIKDSENFIRDINKEIRRVTKILKFLRRNEIKRANRQIKEGIIRLERLEKRLKYWRKLRLITPKEERLLTEKLRGAKDYFIQAYELE